MITLCSRAIIYLFFSITQILIDAYKGMYNTAVVKSMVALIITILLNILCERGLGVVSWFIVFIPFILMTAIVSIILYMFRLDDAVGKSTTCSKHVRTDPEGNIIIYDPDYNPKIKPVQYRAPNIIVPNPDVVVPEYTDDSGLL